MKMAVVDGLEKWALSQKDFLERGLKLMKSGKMFMAEDREGKRVDITAEAIEEREILLAQVNGLLSEHGT
jgi:hypothetical protein